MKELVQFNQKTALLMSVFLILAWNLALYWQHPQPNEMDLVQKFVSDCKSGLKCYNSWAIGWWIVANGGETQYRSGPPDANLLSVPRPFRALTSQVLPDCDLLYAEGIINYYWCK